MNKILIMYWARSQDLPITLQCRDIQSPEYNHLSDFIENLKKLKTFWLAGKADTSSWSKLMNTVFYNHKEIQFFILKKM